VKPPPITTVSVSIASVSGAASVRAGAVTAQMEGGNVTGLLMSFLSLFRLIKRRRLSVYLEISKGLAPLQRCKKKENPGMRDTPE
jgi:hypothetical protein